MKGIILIQIFEVLHLLINVFKKELLKFSRPETNFLTVNCYKISISWGVKHGGGKIYSFNFHYLPKSCIR